MRTVFKFEKLFVSRFEKPFQNLSVLILILVLTLRIIKLPNRAETLTVTLAGVLRFEFCLLSRRNKMRVFFQVFNNFFRDNFTLKTAKRTFD